MGGRSSGRSGSGGPIGILGGALECGVHILGVLEAFVGVFGEDFGDHIVEFFGGLEGGEALVWAGWGVPDLGEHDGKAVALVEVVHIDEGMLAGKHLVKHDANGVKIGACVDGAVQALFGGHVEGGSDDDLCGAVVALVFEKVGDAEVDQFDKERIVVAFDDKDIFGFDIAVDDIFGVGELKGETELVGDMDGFFGGKALALDKDLAEAAALKEFHDVVIAEFRLVSKIVVDADDMFVLLRKKRGDLDLLFEAFDLVGLGGFEGDDLDDALGLSSEVDVFGEINGARAAFAELAHQSVLSSDGFERKAAIEAKGQFCVGAAGQGVTTARASFGGGRAGRCQDRLSWSHGLTVWRKSGAKIADLRRSRVHDNLAQLRHTMQSEERGVGGRWGRWVRRPVQRRARTKNRGYRRRQRGGCPYRCGWLRGQIGGIGSASQRRCFVCRGRGGIVRALRGHRHRRPLLHRKRRQIRRERSRD